MPKIYDQKVFSIKPSLDIFCHTENTRYGFRHLARISQTGDTAKECYYNRTWEAWEYQTVIKTLADKAVRVSDADRQAIKDFAADRHDRDDHGFGSIAMVAAMGSLLCDNQADANSWKTRMIRAGLGSQGLEIPDDWDTLTEDEKTRRLDAVIAELGKVSA